MAPLRSAANASVALAARAATAARAHLLNPWAPQAAVNGSAIGQPSTEGATILTALADGNDVVLGVPMDDNGLTKVVRRVIVLAATGAAFYTCHFIKDLLRTRDDASSLWTAVSSLLIELSIPACGYCGALYCNRQLTCCFCSGNLCVTIVSIVSFVRLNIRVAEIEGRCERESNVQQRRSCEVWMSDSLDKYAMICSTLIIVFIGGLAFWFGNSLYNKLAPDVAISQPVSAPLVGEVIPLSELPTFAAAHVGRYLLGPQVGSSDAEANGSVGGAAGTSAAAATGGGGGGGNDVGDGGGVAAVVAGADDDSVVTFSAATIVSVPPQTDRGGVSSSSGGTASATAAPYRGGGAGGDAEVGNATITAGALPEPGAGSSSSNSASVPVAPTPVGAGDGHAVA